MEVINEENRSDNGDTDGKGPDKIKVEEKPPGNCYWFV